MPPTRLKFTTADDNTRSIRHRENHLIVQFKQLSIGTQRATQILDSIIGPGLYRPAGPAVGTWNYLHVDVLPGKMLSVIDDLNLEGDVEFAELDLPMIPCTTPNDPMLKPGDPLEQWGVENIRMFQGWDIQTGDDSVVIALLDSGVPLPLDQPVPPLALHENLAGHLDHVDLDGKRFIAGWDYVNDQRWPRDEPGSPHGTEMAGIIAAQQNNPGGPLGTAGINWGSSVFAYKALHKTYGDTPTTSELRSTGALVYYGIKDAITFAKSFEPDKNLVINLSLQFEDEKFTMFPEGTLKAVFKLIHENGAVVCIAAGEISGTVLEPAHYAATTSPYNENVIVVGEINRYDRTPYKHEFADMVYAPGTEVGTTDISDLHFTKSIGTSPAAAHVSALAAVLWSEVPEYKAKDVVDVIKGNCRDPEGVEAATTFGATHGFGIIDAYRILQRAQARICLVLDRSGSMSNSSGIPGLTRMDVLKIAANDLIDHVQVGSTLAVTSFDNIGYTDRNPTLIENTADPADDPRALLKNIVNGIEPGGATSLGAGVEEAISILEDPKIHPPRALIILTDGRENHPPMLNSLLESLPAHTTVYAIGMGTPEVLQADPLMEFALNSGGYMVMADDLGIGGNNAVSEFIGQIEAELSEFYPAVDPARVIKPGRVHKFPVHLGPWDLGADIVLTADRDAPLEVDVFSPGNHPWTGHRAKTTRNGRITRYRIDLPPSYSDQFDKYRGEWLVTVSLPETESDKAPSEIPEGRTEQIPQQGLPYILMISTKSSLKMKCRVSQTGYAPGSDMTLEIRLTNGRKPFLAPVEAQVTVTTPGGREQAPKAGKGGAGVLRFQFTAPDPGIYKWFIRVKNVAGSDEVFQRECRLTGAVWRPAMLLGPRPVRIPVPLPPTHK